MERPGTGLAPAPDPCDANTRDGAGAREPRSSVTDRAFRLTYQTVFACALGIAATAQAAELTATTAAESAKLAPASPDLTGLEERLHALEVKAAASGPSEPAAGSIIAGDAGFGVRSASGDFQLKIWGLLQEDVRVFH